MIARMAVAGLLAVNVVLVPWSGGGAASGRGAGQLSGRAGLAVARPRARTAVGRAPLTAPGAAVQARLRAAFDRLPLSFERNIGQAGHGVDFAARGTGYALLVTSAGATLVLAAPHAATRTQSRFGAGAQGARPAAARPNALPTTIPLTSTPTITPTMGTSAPAPVAATTVTPADTVVTPADTAGASPTTAALAALATISAPAPADTAAPADTPAPPRRHGRPTAVPGSGTVVALPPVAHGIVRHASGITQTTVLSPTGLAAAMALHLQHHGHAHGTSPRHTTAAPPAVVQLAFAGANPTPQVVGLDPLAGTATYLLGAARRQWRTKAPTYGRVAYRALYPGIDLAFHGHQGTLEYDWLLAPRAAVGRIRLTMQGAGRLQLDRQGNLLLQTAAGTLRQARPVAYQQVGATRRPVAARYVLRAGHEVGLAVGAYDHTRPLVIDPVLSYASYLGGSDVDQGTSIAVDGSGYVYVAGDTFSSNFPTVNPKQATFAGGVSYGDAFISKLTPDGSSLVYSTYLGGSGDEDAWHIAVDGAGEAVLTGLTSSTDFPTLNAYQPSYGGGPYDAFVSKLSADGSSLVYSTYLGGSGDDEGYGVALDGAGNAYVTGFTSSAYDFPTSATAAQSYFGGYYDAFVTELAPSGSLVYSTYLGGAGDDDGYAIAVDAAGNAYVAGATTSADFPVSANAYQGYRTGACSRNSCTDDAFVAEIAAGGASIAYGTYLGGSGDDAAEGIAVDGSGDAWVTGYTASAYDFPTANAVQATYGGGADDAFVAEFTPDGSALPVASYLGGSGDDAAYSIALDSTGDVYVAAETASTDSGAAGRVGAVMP